MDLVTRFVDYGLRFFERSVVVRYIFSGGISAGIDVGLFYVLHTYTPLYYLYGAAIAMTVSFVVRFVLQKYVTFHNMNETEVPRQFLYYSILYIASLCATAAFMYLFVEMFGIWETLAQVLTIILIAIACFFIYKLYIFKSS